MPEVDFTKSRMVFTAEQIKTISLDHVKEESKSSIRKDIEYLIDDIFLNNSFDEFEATPKDIKEKWFERNSNISISYIAKILREEMKLEPQNMKRYRKFGDFNLDENTGKPYLFKRKSERIVYEDVKDIDFKLPY